MKKIASKKNNSKRNQIILGVVLIFVMFASTFGIVVNSFGNNSNSGKIEYNGFEFVEQNGFWLTSVGNLNLGFRNNPKDVEEIYTEGFFVIEDYYNKPLYIDSKDYEASSEIYTNLNGIALRIQPGCFEKPCEENAPLKTCEDNLIVIKNASYSSIFANESCVFIRGPEENLTEITDDFLFKLFEIR